MASSIPTAAAGHPRLPEDQVKKVQFNALDKALCNAVDSAAVSMDFSTACIEAIKAFQTGDTGMMNLLRAMAAGGPHARAFDDPVGNIKTTASLWIDADKKFVDHLKTAHSLLSVVTEEKTDCYPVGAFASHKSYIVPALREKATTQLQHVMILAQLCSGLRGLTQSDLEVLRGHEALLRENYGITKAMTDSIDATVFAQQ